MATRLSATSNHVTLLVRPHYKRELQSSGVTLLGSEVSKTAVKLSIVDNTDSIGKQDLVVLALKAHQISSSIDLILQLVSKSTVLLTMQNGIPFWYFYGLKKRFGFDYLESVDPGGDIFSRLSGRCTIIGSVVYMAAEMVKTGRVRLIEDSSLLIADILGDGKTKHSIEICELFR